MNRIVLLLIFGLVCFGSVSLEGTLDGFGNIQAVYFHGDYLYVLSGRDMHIVDVSVPEIVAEIDLGDYTMEMDFRGEYAYVVNGQHVAQVNITDPTSPSLVAEYDLPNYGYDISFYGDYAYVPTLEQLSILSIGDGGELDVTGSIASGVTQCKSCDVNGNLLSMGKSESGVHIFDLSSDPGSPTLRGLANTPGWVLDIESNADFLYIADGSMVGIGDGSLCTVDLSTAPLYAIVDTFVSEGGNCFEGCLAGGGYYILADGVSGIRIFSLADPAHPDVIDSYADFTSNVNNVEYHDGIIYAGTNGTLYMLSSDLISTTDILPPAVEVVEPLDGSYSACLNQRIAFQVTDESGVDWDSFRMEIDGYEYTSEMMFREGDIISYSPMIEWPSGVRIEWRVTDICDTEGNCLSDDIAGSFTIEFDEPEISGEMPLDGSTVATSTPLIRVSLSDGTSGIDPYSIFFNYTIDDVVYEGVYPDDISWDGARAILTTMPDLEDGDVVRMTVSCSDNVEYCGPMTAEYSWTFSVDLSGEDVSPPYVVVSYPSTGSFSSVASQSVSWNVSDASEIDVESIIIEADGVEYTVDGVLITYTDGNLTYRPAGGWGEGEHSVSISQISDILGNTATGTGSSIFNIDRTPPRIGWIFPSPGGDFGSPWAVQASIVDRGAGVKADEVRIVIDGEEFVPTVSPEGDSAKVFTAMYGREPEDGLISVCIENIADDIDLGIPNASADSCYSVEDIYELPLNFEIISVAPNPFNAACQIELVLAEPGEVVIEAFDLDGRKVSLIYDGYVDGMLLMRWRPQNLVSGVYFLRMDTPCGVNVERVMLVK